METRASTRRAVRDHIHRFWQGSAVSDVSWANKPVGGPLAYLDISVAATGGPDGTTVYVTNGISAIPRREARYEFIIVAPEVDETHREHLAMVANFQADKSLAPIELGRIVDIGRPWCAHSKCDHFLVSLPYMQGPDFEWCDAGDCRVRFLWLAPITREEAEYVRQHGQESFERLLESNQVAIADPLRESVVCSGDHSGIH